MKGRKADSHVRGLPLTHEAASGTLPVTPPPARCALSGSRGVACRPGRAAHTETNPISYDPSRCAATAFGLASVKMIDGSKSLGRHPKPAIDRHLKTVQRGAGRRDVDLGGGLHACRRDGQRLECRETTAGDRAGPAGVVAPAH